jgi:hypothetical protein
VKFTDKETAFIIKFTVCFVVAAIVLIGVGYAAISVIGSIDFSGKTNPPTPTPFVPTPDPQTTPDPTAKIIIPPTVTPAPTPTPSQYSLNVNYLGDVSSRTYTVGYTLREGSALINLDNMVFSVWKDGIIYKNYTYSEAIDSGSYWSDANGDHLLDKGETFTFKVNGYPLGIEPDIGPSVSLVLNGELIKTTTLPYLINPVITDEPPDPGITPVPSTPYPYEWGY